MQESNNPAEKRGTPPISYYGGKQKMLQYILPIIPQHEIYVEPFCGGAAVFFAKSASTIEVLNDTNSELINFYRCIQNDFSSLEKEIRISLHSRRLHKDAQVIYSNPHMFNEIKRAWAVWVLATEGFCSMLDGTWGYDLKKGTTTRKVTNKRDSFSEQFAIRLQNVQIECTDALRIITTRDRPETFFYCDPPYFNSYCGHYDGYSESDFTALLDQLSQIDGKFLLSSYPSDVLTKFTKKHKWRSKSIIQQVSVNRGGNGRKKTEVLTWNYVE